MRLLVISPVRNEAQHLDGLVASVAAQTRRPDLWVVADDGSNDGTAQKLQELARQVPFLEVVTVPQLSGCSRDRLAAALEARAFNVAVERAGWREFTHIGKLDGDLELPPDYFERLLGEFRLDEGLGIAGGVVVERNRSDGDWALLTAAPPHHVDGALKLYSGQCFEAIGGVVPRLGWDTIDETYARMRGFTTRRFGGLQVRHHRASGSADGRLRGAARHGECAYVTHSSAYWVLLRSFKIATIWRPRAISGFAFFGGYVRGALLRRSRVEDPEFRRFVRREHRLRLQAAAAALAWPIRPPATEEADPFER